MAELNISQTALITGGASGMGLAVAQELSRSGWQVAIVDLNEKQAKEALTTLGPSSMFLRGDVSSYEDQLTAFIKVKEAFGRIDFVFANAGIIGNSSFYDQAKQWPPKIPSLSVQDIGLTGVIYSCYLGMHFMRQNQPIGGSIVMTASGESDLAEGCPVLR